MGKVADEANPSPERSGTVRAGQRSSGAFAEGLMQRRPSGLLAWSWQSRCVVARTLLLLCGLHCAMLTDPVQVSPMSCGLLQCPSWRLWVCPWSVSSGLHDSALQSAVLRRESAWVVVRQISWWHVQPSGVVTYGTWWRRWTFLSARESLCRALCPATSLSAVCEGSWDGNDRVSLHVPLVDSPGLAGIQ